VAGANNGNRRTAERWQELLAPHAAVRIATHWPDEHAAGDRLMLALHARRSAEAISAWARRWPGIGLAVVLTGTDLYQDIAGDATAQQSLALAQRLVVLQECGIAALPPGLQDKARVIFQSTPALPALPKGSSALDVVMVGHLRPVKDPRTLFAAARLLRAHEDIRITHIGDAAEDPALAEAARATQRECPAYSWAGPLSHPETLERIRRAHLLLHTSVLEGGAHVIMEAVRCGTPVIASEVPGNVGMLGPDYGGYFPAGDAHALARLLLDCRASQAEQDPASGLLGRLRAKCALRAPLFDAAAERSALLALLHDLEHPE
jgi:putative glycosyltransferase (TIGR04348 family)